MAIVKRGRRHLYYKSVRVGGKVVSVYKGSGVLAEILAAVDAEEAAARRAAVDAFRERDREDAAVFKQVFDFCQHVNSVVVATLEAEGFHRPFRGPWRKRRVDGGVSRRGAENAETQRAAGVD